MAVDRDRQEKKGGEQRQTGEEGWLTETDRQTGEEGWLTETNRQEKKGG